MRLPPGKIDPALLADLLSSNAIADERVVIRPGIGRDVCAIRMADGYLVAKTDPITFATDHIGWYVVHVNANDLATVGARPRWFLVTALLPEAHADEAMLRTIWEELREALRSIDCELVGGHTEVTVGLDRPILVGQMLGEVAADGLVDKSRIRPGDRILLTKGVPVEGTALLARECADRLSAEFSEEGLARARSFLRDPGISILPEAAAAVACGDAVHGMHDPTEGGVATGLWELGQAADCGMVVHADRIPVLEPGGAMCRHLGLDPLGTISSGTLIVCASHEGAEAVRRAVGEVGVACADVGEVRPASEGIVLVRNGKPGPMPVFAQDEVTRLFSNPGSR